MKTFLSTLSIKTNSFSDESIVIGLIAVTASKVYFEYSKSKIKLLDNIDKSKQLKSFVSSLLFQINITVKNKNKDLSDAQQSLGINVVNFSSDYFSYLSKYNNGMLSFSKPKAISYNFSQKDFIKYFENFVGTTFDDKKDSSKNTLHKKLKPFFNKSGLSEKADLSYTFDHKVFKKVVKDCTIPLITKNGKITALQEIDFNNKTASITNNLYETKILFESLIDFSKKIKVDLSKFKVAFIEPALETEQHELLDLVIKEYSEEFEFVTPDKVDSFTDEIIDSDYSKFSALLEKFNLNTSPA